MTTIVLLLALQQPAAPPLAVPPASPTQEYVIGPQDKLNITVIPDAFSDSKVTVDVDGTFQYRNIGRVNAQDLTVRQIQAAVRKLLIDSNLHRDPTVNVEVIEFRSKMIYVNGDGVKSPQSFRIQQGNDTLIAAIYAAGSFTSKAGSIVTVRRRGTGADGKPIELQIPRRDVEQGTGLAATFHLQDGDLITVPQAGHCFVQGEVRSIGVFDISADATTVFDMINAAGGFTSQARKDDVIIKRLVDGKRKEIKVPKDLLMEVLPNDTIEVPRRRW